MKLILQVKRPLGCCYFPSSPNELGSQCTVAVSLCSVVWDAYRTRPPFAFPAQETSQPGIRPRAQEESRSSEDDVSTHPPAVVPYVKKNYLPQEV